MNLYPKRTHSDGKILPQETSEHCPQCALVLSREPQTSIDLSKGFYIGGYTEDAASREEHGAGLEQEVSVSTDLER